MLYCCTLPRLLFCTWTMRKQSRILIRFPLPECLVSSIWCRRGIYISYEKSQESPFFLYPDSSIDIPKHYLSEESTLQIPTKNFLTDLHGGRKKVAGSRAEMTEEWWLERTQEQIPRGSHVIGHQTGRVFNLFSCWICSLHVDFCQWEMIHMVKQ